MDSEDPDIDMPDEPPRRPSEVVPISVWVVLQLATLGLAAGQVHLWADFPKPAERQAIYEMLVLQIAGSALLFPFLLRSSRSTFMAIAIALPFTQLAGYLSAVQQDRVYSAMKFVSGWLACLGLWRVVLRSQFSQLIGVAAAVGLALGGPLLWYVSAEFGGARSEPDWAAHALYGPVMGAIAIVLQNPYTYRPWWPVAGLFALGIAVFFIARLPRQLFHRRTHA